MDSRQYAPATQRNREPILKVLEQHLPKSGTLLEIASGTGEHAIFFAPHFPDCQWLPSDPNPIARASILAWLVEVPSDNICPPLALGVEETIWPMESPEWLSSGYPIDLQQNPIQAIANINMIHISPWSACVGLMAGAERILPPGGILYLYGPFKQKDKPTAPSNEAFDASLQSQNSEWGIRNLEDVAAIAREHELLLIDTIEMPANNLSVIFQKAIVK